MHPDKKFLPDDRGANLNAMPDMMIVNLDSRDLDESPLQDSGSIERLYLPVKVYSLRHGVFSQSCCRSGEGITGISSPAATAEE